MNVSRTNFGALNNAARRFYSVPSKRTLRAHPPKDMHARVPKFTVPQSEFLTATLFAQHRQIVPAPDHKADRLSFTPVSELIVSPGQTAHDARVPHAPLRQIYAAPASMYMRVPDYAMMPESVHKGPIACALLGKDMFADGVSTLNLEAREVREFVDDFFDSLEEQMQRGSVRRQMGEARALRGSRWAQSETMHMTSVRRKRRSKMNKHKHRKLRKSTRAQRKRLGK
ncbi:hypothetical protein GGH12_001599 [Coemansia sp. RSA 1822]|nr:hypothetical protein LPJ76_004978 [Coemansia sp. RSA 638]KAJ2124374.1 hypothetical protein IW147_001739 [Coemansia sp. RSA 720]KAJ2478630.1 hypothetical protein IWW56_003601 [Coemansia sp. RSA 2131]KAJ2543666.1 hypothetical protein GGF49_001857 [Coemansia sp. RSA 1853]KAJ2565166.1 hypothetical protein GGH12_001599 [Coemansia sp. RSA 1822]KAJ2663488.1 hypothetical protein IW148_002427 [Coemansia sp. RSA 1199]